MFIAAQFTIAKCWKQPKCPSEKEWIKKLWYICTMEIVYSVNPSDFRINSLVLSSASDKKIKKKCRPLTTSYSGYQDHPRRLSNRGNEISSVSEIMHVNGLEQ